MQTDLESLQSLILKDGYLKSIASSEPILKIQHKGESYNLTAFSLGVKTPEAPVLFLTGGIHGLERIGADLCLSLLKSTIDRLTWDQNLRQLLESIRLVFLPLVNPVGYYNFTRSNGKGVDLMRNAPVEALDPVPFLLGGHRISDKIPWYRGPTNILEPENQALVDLFSRECSLSRCVISLDFHSGFGLQDRLWFPYSKTKEPFEHLAEMNSFVQLFENTHPYHIYKIEPQSHAYLLNGDIWDYLYADYIKKNSNVYLPLTLEMGSWNWVKKNPLQLISKDGLFNPVKKHRVKRTFRRHHLLFDFILRALYSFEALHIKDSNMKHKHKSLAMERWYDT